MMGMLIAHMMKLSNQLMVMIQHLILDMMTDDSGMLAVAPDHDEDLVLNKFPVDVDLISLELYMKDDNGKQIQKLE